MKQPCGRCGKRVAEPEYCWWCSADLCPTCWEEVGHCGHLEAEAANRIARDRLTGGERAAVLAGVIGSRQS